MAEIFKNFLSVSKQVGTEKIIIPSALAGQNTTNVLSGSSSMGEVLREEGSTVQVHSLYICNVFDPRIEEYDKNTHTYPRYEPKNFKSIDLYIKDGSNSIIQTYIAHDIRIVPGSSFYIEKNITLTPSQYLCMFCPAGIVGNTNGINMNITASAILFVEDVEE